MDVQTPSLEDVIAAALEQRLASLFTAIPGVVSSYDSGKQIVSVQPAVRQAYTSETGDRVAERLPVLQGVPVLFTGTGAYSQTWPISAGDTGLIFFASCPTDRWLALGGNDVDPLYDAQKHHIASAFFLPALRPVFATGGALASPGSDAWTVTAPLLRLGGTDAAQSALQGDAFKSALDTWLDALNTCLTALADLGAQTTAVGTYEVAVTSFKTAVQNALSSVVKVK